MPSRIGSAPSHNGVAPTTYSSAVSVTPSDSTDLTNPSLALWIGGAGAVNVDLLEGGTVVFSAIPAGTLLPIRAKRVRSTSTTATLILSLD